MSPPISGVFLSFTIRLAQSGVSLTNGRPTSYTRNAFHMTTSCIGLWVVTQMDERGAFEVAAALLVLFWAIEAFRFLYAPFNRLLLHVTHWMARPHEASHITSATWYMCAAFLLACLWNLPVATLAIVICGLGDPAAAMIGRRFGRRKIFYGRTVAGCLGFLMVSIVAGSAWLSVVYDFDVSRALWWSLGGGVFGMLAELFSRKIDDNFSIPLAAAAGTLLIATWVG